MRFIAFSAFSDVFNLPTLGINPPAKNAVYPKQMRYTRQTKQKIQKYYILLYNMLYYFPTLMYHEITTNKGTS